MKFLFQNLWERKRAVALIVVLLLLQSLCELSLPSITANIVDVGIQQYGVKSIAMEAMTPETMESLVPLLTEEERTYVKECYTYSEEGQRYILHTVYDRKAAKEQKSRLEEILTEPLVMLYALEMGTQASFDVQGLQRGDLAELGGTMLNQMAVQRVMMEYEALGYDMKQYQMNYLLREGLIMILLTLGMLVAAITLGYVASHVGAGIGRDLREKVYNSIMTYSGKEIDRFSTASLITRCTNDVQQIQMVSVLILRIVLYAPILAIGGICMIAGTDTSMSWIIVVAVAVIVAVVLLLLKFAMPKFKIMQQLVDRMNLVSREILTGIPVIRAFSREEKEKDRFEEANANLMETQLFTGRMMAWMMPVMMLIMNTITIAVVWFGAKGVAAGNLQVGDMMAFITYAMVIVMSFLMMTMMSVMLPRAGVAAERIEEVILTKTSIVDEDVTEDDRLSEVKGEIAFHDVSFAYPNAKSHVLEHLDFVAEPGKTTAIIGSTGCGKSTLLNLIPRLYDVTEGSITLDGVDIRRLSQKKLRSVIGYVPQKAVLFSGNIRSNIKYADEEGITDETMKTAAMISQSEEFISEKEKTYDSSISQGGTNVSGGQKQRLSIARAVAKNPKVYLFDDSFSALDFKTDQALRKALFAQAKEATVIIVAQRISTILHADQILVLDDGRIVGKGTHQELLRNCEAYMEIAVSQLSEQEINKTRGGISHE